MSREKVDNGPRILSVAALIVFIALNLPGHVNSVSGDEELNQPTNPAAVQLFTQVVYNQFNNLSRFLSPDILNQLSFCIKDVDVEWNSAFNFSANLDFLTACIQKTRGDLPQRLCTAAEVKFFFSSFFQGGSKKTNYLKPNRNCNLTSWVPGCEPGWSCSVGKGKKVDLKSSKEVPDRTLNCLPCCEGFFCPHGITSCDPCPLGSYCPLAKLNETTGVCDPYRYQLPPGQTNHSCGGADIWADIVSSSEVFCSAGSYCPTTVKKIPCTSGHFCRTGSTSQTGCFSLATCEAQTEIQNITAYGILLFAGLTLILLIIYNCSDQVLTTREKRQAKSREAAARSARETVQARERWKSAKDVARKGAVGLQTQLSRTFSRKKSVRQPEPLKGLGQPKPGTDASLPPMPLKGKKKEQSNLTKMMHELDEDPDSHEGFNLEIGDKNLKKNMPKGKQLHTRSQIFKYAYGQIEKEKALQEQNKNLTFSGVISMASDTEIRSRPTIEVAFKDLTLTLKGKNKHLLRCVTGKILPGRVSAVMGPSGAGKTTFLSALAGKATGCTMSGMVIINGKVESILSYKKIIGFVPQDDVVHGNLTVEENLWFSARCSYSLFKMFDELILLAKGGLTAYHGPVKKVEEYFAGLGINVPDRVNPPDHFIDILEGIVKPSTSSGINYKELPLRWMLHNGYTVPPDMLTSAGMSASSADNSAHGTNAAAPGSDGQSFAGDLWQDVKFNAELKKAHLQHQLLKAQDLSDRKTPGVFQQYRYFLGRVGKQRLRESRMQAVDFLILLLAGICLGTLAKVSDETFGALGYTYTVIAISLLSGIAALRSFALDKLHYWRESASGMSSLAYFLAKDTIDHFNTIIKPVVYLSMFYFFNNPRSSFFDNYIVLVCLVYCVTGIAYAFAIYLEPGPAQLWSVLLPVVLTLLANQNYTEGILKIVENMCYTKWALEAFVIANAERYSGVWLITRCGSLMNYNYKLNDWFPCIIYLILGGIVSRCVAFFCLVTFQKK
ncbi:ABC transporter G family member 28 [Camellia lanceoleosa]|uniref:ABC transporter G family member 28 n=1 Tax=Camellia lanceoleosa TaxID=1840588 RepID=A0ACC0F351_9ERIC|nr:ABC transporter G family member 28 [Camellia lanceoleosa]